jgi:hypothetical protein
MKSMNIRAQHLCDEYPFWVPYLSFEKEDCAWFLCMILDCMWLWEYSWGRNVYMTLKIEVKNMEVSCTLIVAMKNGWSYII